MLPIKKALCPCLSTRRIRTLPKLWWGGRAAETEWRSGRSLDWWPRRCCCWRCPLRELRRSRASISGRNCCMGYFYFIQLVLSCILKGEAKTTLALTYIGFVVWKLEWAENTPSKSKFKSWRSQSYKAGRRSNLKVQSMIKMMVMIEQLRRYWKRKSNF